MRRPLAILIYPTLIAGLMSCGDSTSPAPGLSATIQSGATQTASVGTVLPESLVVLIKHGNTPVTGAVVHFAAGTNQGTLSKTADTTRTDGTARVAWTLPTTTGSHLAVKAYVLIPKDSTVDSTLIGTFTATATTGPVKQVLVVSGSLQTGSPNTAMADPLVAKVTDQYGNPVTGRTVTWTVVSGGGTVTPSTSTTDGSGVTSAHGTYGTSYGANVMTATTDSVATPASFVNAASAGASSTITATATTGPDFPQAFVNVSVSITSTYQISSVVGTFNGQSVAFTVSGTTAGGAFTLTAVPRGRLDTANVSIVDAVGNVKTIPVTFTRAYLAPTITVTSPANSAIVGTSVSAQATCATSDPAGCTLTVVRAGQTLGTGHGTVTATVPLSSYLDTWVPIIFTATDGMGQAFADTNYVLPTVNPHLITVVTTDGAAVLDYDGSRVLYRSGQNQYLSDTTKLLSSAATVTVLAADASYGHVTYAGQLTPSGAAYQRGLLDHQTSIFLYNGASTATLGNQNENFTYQAAGSYLLWWDQTLWSPPNLSDGQLLVTDLTTGSAIDTLSTNTSGFDLAPNGTLVVTTRNSANIVAKGPTLNGTLTQNDSSRRALNPKTDGASVVYSLYQSGILPTTGGFASLRLYSQGQDVELVNTGQGSYNASTFLKTYMVNGGWVAYSLPSLSDPNTRQLWIRNPQGVTTQASPLTGDNEPVALADDGRLVFQNASKLYLTSAPYGVPTEIGNFLGRVVLRNGQFYEFVRGTVARIQ